MHPYTNMPDERFEVVADNYIDAFAEKFRALAGRTRPRDFYDVVNLYRIGSMSKQGGAIWFLSDGLTS
jgi:predicted nucleotidyltransferase component of viral defense system